MCSWLTGALCCQNKYNEGVAILEKALAVRKRVIGVKHPTYQVGGFIACKL